ncbi:MAG: bifunctional glutamate N-acetyltransferase/amino-acid acetyltransferase ArgJ [Clostridia bacterium]
MILLKIIKDKTITDVPFFKASGVISGIKKNGSKDLCIIYSEKESVAAAAFTANMVKAAPVLLNMEHIQSKNTQAIVVNSGNANACTGKQGHKDAKTMAELTASLLNIPPDSVLVASTGVIGVPLPMHCVESGIKNACENLSYDGGKDAVQAIMTTDTYAKSVTVEAELDGKVVLLSGIAKGSGMIHPNMATMLSFITTDANITKAMLQEALSESVQKTYNMISVDGDTSTNDMVIILANAAADNKPIESKDASFDTFKKALELLNTELAKLIARDGEGATKLIECTVINAQSAADACKLSKSVISSDLVKAAFFGNDANWGRILCALGYSGGHFSPEKVDVFFESKAGCIQLVAGGEPLQFCEETASAVMAEEYVKIKVDLKEGSFSATAWGCDLTYDYVKINGSYRS